MTLTVNGEHKDVEASTVSALLVAMGLDGAIVATALNGSFVAKSKRDRTTLNAGDRVEIVAPMQGG